MLCVQVSEQFHTLSAENLAMLHTGAEAVSGSNEIDLGHILHHAQPTAADKQTTNNNAPQTIPTPMLLSSSSKIPAIYDHIRDYDFPLLANFCNSFVLASVLPVWGKVIHVTEVPQQQPEKTATMMEVQPGIIMAHSHDEPHIQETLAKMRSELDRLHAGVKAFVSDRDSKIRFQDEERVKNTTANAHGGTVPIAPDASASAVPTVDLSQHMFMPSALRNIHYTQKVVKLQQALQQAYCMHGVETANIVLSEPNSMQFASGATCLQLHRASVTFPVMTEIHNTR